jgi:toxin ParE1/3/4
VKLEVDSDFWREVVTIGARYEGERDGLGEDFVAAVDLALGQILAHPSAWAVWPGLRQPAHPIRRYVMARFPYVIAYQIVNDTVAIAGIAHSKRRPGAWR